MAAWYLNAFLFSFRSAINKRWAMRDKTTDGTIGDAAHQSTNSDHNPDADGQPDAGSVDAWDMDRDLEGPNTPDSVVYYVIAVFQQQAGARYWIYKGEIARKSTGWKREIYTGSNKHTQHIHFNSDEATETTTVSVDLFMGGTLKMDRNEELALLEAATLIKWNIHGWLKNFIDDEAAEDAAEAARDEAGKQRDIALSNAVAAIAVGGITDEQMDAMALKFKAAVDDPEMGPEEYRLLMREELAKIHLQVVPPTA